MVSDKFGAIQCPTPGRGDGCIFPGPFFLEGIELGLGHISARGSVYQAQIGGDGLAILPRAIIQRMAHQMHDTG